MKKISRLIIVAGIAFSSLAANATPIVLESFVAPEIVASANRSLENAVAAQLSASVVSQTQVGIEQVSFDYGASTAEAGSNIDVTYLSSVSEPLALSIIGAILAFLGTLKRKGRA